MNQKQRKTAMWRFLRDAWFSGASIDDALTDEAIAKFSTPEDRLEMSSELYNHLNGRRWRWLKERMRKEVFVDGEWVTR